MTGVRVGLVVLIAALISTQTGCAGAYVGGDAGAHTTRSRASASLGMSASPVVAGAGGPIPSLQVRA